MPFLVLSVVIQVALVLHILKTGRNTRWIWIIVMLPLAGSIAYLCLEIMPEMANSRAGRSASKTVAKTINPNKGLKRAVTDYTVAETTENSLLLAEELIDKGMYSEAKSLYEKCLTGIYETDPLIMYGLARTEFELGNYQAALTLLDQLIEHNPDFKNAGAHLLYARVQEALGNSAAAQHEYEALHLYFPGPEASFRYAMLCKTLGDLARTEQLCDEIVKRSEVSGRHYYSLYKEWIKKAKEQRRQLTKNSG